MLELYRSGTVESRVRQLVMKLELVEALQLVHPFIKGFDQLHHVIGEAELTAVTAGEISETVTKRTAQDIEDVEGGKAIHSTTFFIGLQVEPKPGKDSDLVVDIPDSSEVFLLSFLL